MPGDGKSLTAANLAACLAANVEGRVVLVDADLRTPKAHSLLGVPQSRGLAEYLRGEAPIDKVLHDSPIERLAVLPGGSRPTPNPSHLLTSPRFRDLVTQLRERFDEIIIDSAPLLPLADARALAELADGVLLVIRAGQTRRVQAEDAIQRLNGARLLGLVFNGVRRSELENYYGYGGSS
jgi:non-specific protein-tyrosine kinase